MVTSACSFSGEDFTVARLIMLVIIGTETVVGAWINSFIVTLCCIYRVKNKSLSAGDQILMVLAANRFCFLIVGIVRVLCRTLSPEIYYKDLVHRGLKATLWYFISSNLWIAACLCLFYCVKITNFSHSFFIFLKLKISRAVPALLLCSQLLSFVNTVPFFRLLYMVQCHLPNATAPGNNTTNPIDKRTDLLKLLFSCVFGFSVVFVVFVASAILLLISFWRHARRLRDILSSSVSPGMAAHVRAVRTITYFLVTYLVNFMVSLLGLTDRFAEDSDLSLMCAVIIYACTSVHSVVLILTHPKFKKAFLQTLRHGSCRW